MTRGRILLVAVLSCVTNACSGEATTPAPSTEDAGARDTSSMDSADTGSVEDTASPASDADSDAVELGDGSADSTVDGAPEAEVIDLDAGDAPFLPDLGSGD